MWSIQILLILNLIINLSSKDKISYYQTIKELKMRKIFQFGETVDGYNIPVLNEREIRAGAGILFLMMFISILHVIYTGDFTLLKFGIVIFLTDISIRVFINPKFAPSLILGRLIVRNQTPEYVGAAQKKFAWIIGVFLAISIFTLLVAMNTFSIFTGLICLICLIFLFWEAAFGICIGCLFYKWFKKEQAQYCPGEVCDIKSKHEIQKTSIAQVIIVAGFIAYVFLTVQLFNDSFKKEPTELFTGKSLQEAQQ